MPKIHVIHESGEPDRTIEFSPTEAPFSHDGEPGSILDVLLGHKVHLEHACGGKCACTTCHVIVKEGEENLSEMRDLPYEIYFPTHARYGTVGLASFSF